MSEGFLLDLRTAELFYRMCNRYRIDGITERTALMREIVRRGKAKYLRDVAEFTEGKAVLKVTKRSHNAN